MKSRTPVVTFVVVLACVLFALALIFVIVPLALKVATGVFALLLWLLPLLFTIAALVSCIGSSKRKETKILWTIIIVLAPFFGPLLWFLWGKSHT
jgi:hypothetical protein